MNKIPCSTFTLASGRFEISLQEAAAGADPLRATARRESRPAGFGVPRKPPGSRCSRSLRRAMRWRDRARLRLRSCPQCQRQLRLENRSRTIKRRTGRPLNSAARCCRRSSTPRSRRWYASSTRSSPDRRPRRTPGPSERLDPEWGRACSLRRCDGRGLVQAFRIAQHPFHQVVHQRDRNVRHEQAADGLANAAVGPGARQPAQSTARRRWRPTKNIAVSTVYGLQSCMPKPHHCRRDNHRPRAPLHRRSPADRVGNGQRCAERGSASRAPSAAAYFGTKRRCRTRRGTSLRTQSAGSDHRRSETPPNKSNVARIAADEMIRGSNFFSKLVRAARP